MVYKLVVDSVVYSGGGGCSIVGCADAGHAVWPKFPLYYGVGLVPEISHHAVVILLMRSKSPALFSL